MLPSRNYRTSRAVALEDVITYSDQKSSILWVLVRTSAPR